MGQIVSDCTAAECINHNKGTSQMNLCRDPTQVAESTFCLNYQSGTQKR